MATRPGVVFGGGGVGRERWWIRNIRLPWMPRALSPPSSSTVWMLRWPRRYHRPTTSPSVAGAPGALEEAEKEASGAATESGSMAASAAAEEVEITVTWLSEEVLRGSFVATTTVAALKSQLDLGDQKASLIFKDKELDDTATLGALELQGGDVLQVVFLA